MRLVLLALALTLAVPVVHTSDAQILGRLGKRAAKAAQREAEARAAREAERRAAEAANAAMERVLGPEDSTAAALSVPGMGSTPMGAMMGMGGSGVEGLVDFRTLQEYLPANASGLPRTDMSGESGGAMGMAMSQASAMYEAGDVSVELTIVDVGTMSAYLQMAAAWQNAEIDQQSSRGYEKTRQIGGFPGYVQEVRGEGELASSVAVVMGGRLMVSASGDGVGGEGLTGFVGSLDLAGLNALGEELAAQAPQVVGFRELLGLLPQSAPGLVRQEPSGETTDAMGVQISEASVAFCEGDDYKTCVHVQIQDFGPSIGGLGAMPFGVWANATFNRESTDGFERTTKIGGYPAQETFSESAGISNIEVLVANRFLVSAGGTQAFDVVRALVERVDLAGLAAKAGN